MKVKNVKKNGEPWVMEEIAVLIVDDEQGLRDMLTTVLKKKDSFKSSMLQRVGKRCKSWWNLMWMWLYLMLSLPDNDGFEVCRQMRLYTDAPILFWRQEIQT